MRIIILGAGAIGSVYGAKLSRHHDVTLIGGAAHVAAIQRDGLRDAGPARRHAAPAGRSPRLASIEPGTLILLTTKVNNNVAAVDADRRRCCRTGVTIVCVQNGLYSEDLVKALVERSRAGAARDHAGRRRAGAPGRRGQHRRRLHAA